MGEGRALLEGVGERVLPSPRVFVRDFTNLEVAVTTASDDLRQQVRQAVDKQPYATVTVLSSLLAVQDAVGYLPSEAMDEVSERTGASVNDVWGVASFYPNFRFTPPGRHRVEVCWGRPATSWGLRICSTESWSGWSSPLRGRLRTALSP